MNYKPLSVGETNTGYIRIRGAVAREDQEMESWYGGERKI